LYTYCHIPLPTIIATYVRCRQQGCYININVMLMPDVKSQIQPRPLGLPYSPSVDTLKLTSKLLMRLSTSCLSLLATCLAAGVKATPAGTSGAELDARTTIFYGNGEIVGSIHRPRTDSSHLATWYTPNGNYGAYGAPMQNSDFVVALSSAHTTGVRIAGSISMSNVGASLYQCSTRHSSSSR
jgi:hypothetical protein